MFKNNVNYKNLFKTLGLGGALLFASCNKTENECNDPYDPSCSNYNPKLAQIDALRTDSTRLAGEVRAAVGPAKTEPTDITNHFNSTFVSAAREIFDVPTVGNLPDSALVLKRTIELHRDFCDRNGFEIVNNITTTNLYNKSTDYILIIADLQNLR